MHFAVTVLLLLATAPTPRYYGTYRGYWGEFTLAAKDGKPHLDFIVGIPGCTGSIEGDGKLEKNVFTYTTNVEGQEDPCVLTITFSGRKAAVASEHCGYFHGASCEFDGEDYTRVPPPGQPA